MAGIHAALAVMTGIEQRDRTGEGCEIDLAHMEVMWCQLGEDLVLAHGQGRDAQRMGNREPGVAVSGIFPTSNDRWVAVVGDDSVASLCASSARHAAYEFVALVVAAGGRAEIVNGLIDAVNDPRLAKYFETVDHPVTGPTRHARAPFALDGEPAWSRAPAALFDQHTDECLRELGYDPGRIRWLRAAGVVGGTLPVPAAGG